MACRWRLTLTGTFADGYSSNVMHLLWRFTNPKLRKLWKRNETGRWAKKYGIIKATRYGSTTPPDEVDEAEVDGANSDREIGGRLKFEEAPGISAEVGLLTIPHTVYLNLVDVAKDLPPYEEFPRDNIRMRDKSDGLYPEDYPVELLRGKALPSQAEAYDKLQTELVNAIKAQMARGSSRLLGAMVHSLLAYPDNPTRAEIVEDPATKAIVATAPALPSNIIYPKEKLLQEHWLKEKAKGRKMMVYIAYTGKRDMAPRLKWVLEQCDPAVKVSIMGDVDTRKRFEWIKKEHAKGMDVLITHPKKVEVGLTLLMFPSIYWYNIYYVTQTVEQAKKRSWRIGQTKPCHTHFWAYGNTAQSKGLRHIARKVYAAKKLNGQIIDAGLTELLEDDEDESILKAIAHSIASGEDDNDAINLEKLMAQTLDEELKDAAFILTDKDAAEASVEDAITTLYEKTYGVVTTTMEVDLSKVALKTPPVQVTRVFDFDDFFEQGEAGAVTTQVWQKPAPQVITHVFNTAEFLDEAAIAPKDSGIVELVSRVASAVEKTNQKHISVTEDGSHVTIDLTEVKPVKPTGISEEFLDFAPVKVAETPKRPTLEEFRDKLLQARQAAVKKKTPPSELKSMFD